jgi:energy-coupling factor transporter ATP-binding protein EcfA2
MLKSVRIQNFRSCRDVLLSGLPSLTALIGRNGAGKTNILRAISWLVRTATAADYSEFGGRPFYTQPTPMSVEIEFRLADQTFKYFLQRNRQIVDKRLSYDLRETLHSTNKGSEELLFDRTGQRVASPRHPEGLTLNPRTSSIIGLIAILPPADPMMTYLIPIYRFLSSIRYYPIDEPCDPEQALDATYISEKSYQEWLAKYTETKIPGDNVPMRILHMSLAQKDQFAKLCEWIGLDNLGIIAGIQVNRFVTDSAGSSGSGPSKMVFYGPTFTPIQCAGSEESQFSYGDLSTGTRRALKILVSLLFDESSVMLLEHPEDGLHSLLVSELVSFLKSHLNEAQVILTSHSLTILDELEPDNIRIVTMDECKTQVRALKNKEKKAAHDYMTKKGRFSEYVELVQEVEAAESQK